MSEEVNGFLDVGYRNNLMELSFNINGFPYGLGNKIEELLNLEAYCIRTGKKCNYYWNNEDDKRSYPILVGFKNINIQSEHRFEDAIVLPGYLWLGPVFASRQEMLQAVKNMDIKFTFNKPIDSYVGVHIRRTDRIQDVVTYCDYMDKDCADLLFMRTVGLLNREKPKNLFVCSDDDKYKNIFIKLLDSNINIIRTNTMDCPQVYQDWYTLANSDKIIMCSKMSSFAAIASLVKDIPLVSFFNEKDTTLIRCGTKVCYI